MNILSKLKAMKYESREKLLKGEKFDSAELENIKAERKALKTKADLRAEKKALKKEKFQGSFIGRAIGSFKEKSTAPRTTTKRKTFKKRVSVSKPKTRKVLGKAQGFGNQEINEAFSLGKPKEKKRFFYE